MCTLQNRFLTFVIGTLLALGLFLPASAQSAEPIVIGACTELGILEGRECVQAMNLAAEEINARGGVNIVGKMRPLKIVAVNSRDMEPGIPVSQALMAYEKLILEHKPHAIIPGFPNSETELAAMDITSKYKLPYLATMSMSPKLSEKVLNNYDAYKYNFRLCYNSIDFAKAYLRIFEMIKEEFGFDTVFILNDEALWARNIAGFAKRWFEEQGWKLTGMETFPKGTSDFSASLLRAANPFG